MTTKADSIINRVGQLESDVLDAADAIAGYAATDFGMIDDVLAMSMKSVFLRGEEHILRTVAQELNEIFHELHEAAVF